MLQNRVNPFGEIIRTEARGTITGTRGIIHNDHREIVRAFKHKAWITCLLEFKGRRRQVMSPGRYTELFFLDEATAFAAGHRPCAECRRTAFNKFKSCWILGNPEYGFDMKTSIQKIDDIIHGERIGHGGKKVISEVEGAIIPNGVFVALNEEPVLVNQGKMYGWTPAGYRKGKTLSAVMRYQIITPVSIVNAFRAGYRPQFNTIAVMNS